MAIPASANPAHPAVKALRQAGASKVKVAVSDIDGVLRGKYLHQDKFFGVADPYPDGGFGFCDVVLGWDLPLVSARRRNKPTGRFCSRPAPRKSARALASCPASWPSRSKACRVAAGTSTSACRMAKTTCFMTPATRARWARCLKAMSPARWPA